jgi:hypothetical protein
VIARLLLVAALLVAAPAGAEDRGWQAARAHARCVALAPERSAHQRHLSAGYTLLKRTVEQEAGTRTAAELLAAHMGASLAEVTAYLYGEMVAEARQQVREAMPPGVREERSPGDRDRWRVAEYDRTNCASLR